MYVTLTNGYPPVNLFRVIERYICTSWKIIQIVFLFETLNYEKGFETMNCTTIPILHDALIIFHIALIINYLKFRR